MISQYSVKNSQRTFMYLYRLETKFKNRALTFATVHKYQFPLLHYFRMQRINLEVWFVDFPKQFPRLDSCCVHDRPWCAGTTGAIFTVAVTFGHFLSLCAILWHAALSLRPHRTHLSTGSELVGGKRGSPIRNESQYVPLRRNKSLQCYQLPPRIASDCCPICCTLSLMPVLPSTKKLNASITLRNSTSCNASYKHI